MAKSLIIAEKPSVAADIARALGGFARHADYFESDRYVLSSAIGHLLELGMPEEEEVKRGKWTFAHLPAIPSKFALKPIEKAESRLRLLLKLLRRKDVTRVGERLRRGPRRRAHLPQHRPVREDRQADQAPLAAVDDPGLDTRRLRATSPRRVHASPRRCRRLPVRIRLAGGHQRHARDDGVQLQIRRLSADDGWARTNADPCHTCRARREDPSVPGPRLLGGARHIRAASGEYNGRWFNESFKKSDDDADARAERLWDEASAAAIAAKCEGQRGIVTEETKPSTQMSPLLYDLTSLQQREANGRFGLSARTTLSLAQALYEKHKVLTYPRTDSRALPEDYLSTVKETLESLRESNAYSVLAGQVLKAKWVKPNKRIFDNSKISDHFAIIPTLQQPRSLNELEAKLYDLVVKRFLAVFYPPAEYLLTTRITRVAGEPFKTEGKVLVSPGWLAVYGKEAQVDTDPTLPAVKENETVATEEIRVAANQTKPPARFTEATLLSAMEGAGKLIDDDELREAMREKGLGTPATRAQIIEGLILEKYVLREGRELQPTAKAFSLMTLLHGLGIPELFSPELTAEWEFKLSQMEHGKLKREQFMREIVKMTRHIVGQAKNYESDTIPGDFATLQARCPKCGGEMHENYKKIQCQSCDFGFWKIVAGRQFDVAEAETLLTQRAVGPLEGSEASWGARSRRRSSSMTRTKSSSTSATAPGKAATLFLISAGRNRSGRARNAATRSSSFRRPMSARRRSGRTRPATSAPDA